MKIIKSILVSAFIILTFAIGAMAQVSVTATAGTTGPTAYTTVGGAFTAINAGTHQGVITIDITANTTETGAAVLNSSGAGSASYTSILMRPTVDGVTIAGPTVTGRGLIELNGADNVTIDGDNPNTGGTNRNLTITNTAVNTITYTSVIRIALATTVVTSADNNTIKNLILNGSATGRNISTATSTTGSENTTYGVLATGGASTVAATTAPSAITSTTTTIGSGATATNLTIDNNAVNSAARGFTLQGAATTVFPGAVVSNNLIGNATTGGANQVYSIGASVQGSTNASVRDNTVYVEGFISTSIRGLDQGSISSAGSGTLFERNKVNRVQSNSGSGYGAYGINLGGGNTHTIRNNFVSGILNGVVTSTAFSTTFGAFGIRIGAGTGHFVYHNSVNLYGTVPGNLADLSAAFAITATTITGVDARNNIFVNTQTQPTATTPANSAFVAIFLPSGGTSAMNLTLNNNDYYIGATPAVNNGYGQKGTTAGGTNFFTTFNAADTTDPTNLRSYTSTLNAAGTNDNASKAVDPQFVSATDLHIAAASPLVDMGVDVGVVQDIDGQNRVPPPDIGADEPSGTTALANDIAATAIVTPANGSTVLTGTVITPQATFTNVGTATQTNVMVQFTITGPGGYSYSNTQTIATIAPNQTVTVTFAPAPAVTTPGTYNTTATVLTADGNAANNTVTGTFTVPTPLPGGTFNVPGDYPSLTNPGGIFEALNTSGASGNVVINITADLTGETGVVGLNELGSGITVTIKPSGAARTISGSSATASPRSLIRLNGADNVTIDGSTSGGTDKSLTISNTDTGGGVVQFVNAATNNTVKNTVLQGVSISTSQGVVWFSTVASGTTGNSTNTIQNNDIRGGATAQAYGVYNSGTSTAKNANNVITRNRIFDFSNTGIRDDSSSANATYSQNEIFEMTAQTTSLTGFRPSSTTIDGFTFTRNFIHDLNTTSTGFVYGIYLFDTSTAQTSTISNNMITLSPTAPLTLRGIYDQTATAEMYDIYYNSIYIGGTVTGASNSEAYYRAIASITNLRDNILVNARTGGTGKHYAIRTTSSLTAFTSDYNDIYNTGGTANVFGNDGTADRADLAAWRTANPTLDANSISADPLFVDPITNLHIQSTSPVIDMGIIIAGVTVDFDGQTRGAAFSSPSGVGTTDIGADEFFVPTAASVNVGGRVVTSTGRGVFGARVFMTDPQGNVVMRQTNSSGYYRFLDVSVGETYILTVGHKNLTFAQPSQTLFVSDENLGVNFVATGLNLERTDLPPVAPEKNKE